MHSLQELFNEPPFTDVSRLIVFRCTWDLTTRGTYASLVNGLRLGRVGQFPIRDSSVFGGAVVLLDRESRDGVEVWAGRISGPNSGRIGERGRLRRRTIQVDGPFVPYGLLEGTVKDAIGHHPSGLTSYVERIAPLGARSAAAVAGANRRGVRAPAATVTTAPAVRSHGVRGFNPEFAAELPMVVPDSYTAARLHGEVVNALHNWLQLLGYQDLDNKSGDHDLHGKTADGSWELFEVKSDSSPYSVYTALGQLQLYGLRTGPSRKIAVLPFSREAVARWKDPLALVDVRLITFEKEAEGIAFKAHT